MATKNLRTTFVHASRRHGDTGETVWINIGAINCITLPWRSDVRFNPYAADYPTPYLISFERDGENVQAFASADDLRAAAVPLPVRRSVSGN